MKRATVKDLKTEVDAMNKSNIYTHIVIRAALLKNEPSADEFAFGRIDYSNEANKPKDENIDFGNFELIRKVFDISDSDRIIADVVEGYLDIGMKKVLRRNSGGIISKEFVPSGYSWWLIDSDTPLYSIQLGTTGQMLSLELAAQTGPVPYFVNVSQAITTYMELGGESYNRECIIILPETRAKIGELTIVGKELSITIESSFPHADFAVKFSCRKGRTKHESSSDIEFKSGLAKFVCSFEPDEADVALIHKKTNEMVDMKQYRGLSTIQRGVTIKTPETLISEMIAAGETKTVELKTGIEDRDEILETIVSFANTDGGTIIVGVADNKTIRGFYDDPDRAEKSIMARVRSLCEPLIEPRLQWAKVAEKPVLLIKVDEGKEKPYNVLDRGIFVRENKDDYHIRRARLDAIYDSRKPQI